MIYFKLRFKTSAWLHSCRTSCSTTHTSVLQWAWEAVSLYFQLPPPCAPRCACAASPENRTRLPARLSPVPEPRDAHTEPEEQEEQEEDTAARECAQLRATAGDRRLHTPGDSPEPQRHGLGGIWQTLAHFASWGEEITSESWIESTIRLERGGGGRRRRRTEEGTWFLSFSTPAPLPLCSGEMITELACTAVAVGLYVNTLDADFCYDDRYDGVRSAVSLRSSTCHRLSLEAEEEDEEGWGRGGGGGGGGGGVGGRSARWFACAFVRLASR